MNPKKTHPYNLMRIISSLSQIHNLHLHFNPFKFLSCSFISTTSQPQLLIPNPLLINYLIGSFGLSKSRADAAATRFSWIKSIEKPQSVVNYFRKIGFTETHIRVCANVMPQLLFTSVDKTLKPKIEFLQELGFVGADLGEFVSKNPCLLTHSLSNRLIPCTQILKKVLINDKNNQNLFRALRRNRSIITKDPKTSLLCNIEILQSCGIVGSQLSMLLTRQPSLFITKESKLKELILHVLNMGFSINSRMFVHAMFTLSSLSEKTLKRKFDLFLSFGISNDECMDMFRRAPGLLRASEKKLKFGIDFLMNTIKFNNLSLVRHPTFLMYSMEHRVIPRYKVLQLIKSKMLLKKEPSFVNVVFYLTNEEFLERFIIRFRDDAEELLIAYKGHLLDSANE